MAWQAADLQWLGGRFGIAQKVAGLGRAPLPQSTLHPAPAPNVVGAAHGGDRWTSTLMRPRRVLDGFRQAMGAVG